MWRLFFVAVASDETVGFIIANQQELKQILVENMFITPGFRGQGIGFNLAKKIIERTESGQCQFISVLTLPDDIAAIKTYEKAGLSKGEIFLWLDIV